MDNILFNLVSFLSIMLTYIGTTVETKILLGLANWVLLFDQERRADGWIF